MRVILATLDDDDEEEDDPDYNSEAEEEEDEEEDEEDPVNLRDRMSELERQRSIQDTQVNQVLIIDNSSSLFTSG